MGVWGFIGVEVTKCRSIEVSSPPQAGEEEDLNPSPDFSLRPSALQALISFDKPKLLPISNLCGSVVRKIDFLDKKRGS